MSNDPETVKASPEQVEAADELFEELEYSDGGRERRRIIAAFLCRREAELQAALSGRTVSCVCGGEGKITKVRAEAKAEAFEEVASAFDDARKKSKGLSREERGLVAQLVDVFEDRATALRKESAL